MKWQYQAVGVQKLPVKGFMDATTAGEVARSLLEQQLTPIRITSATSGLGLNQLLASFSRIGEVEVTNFTRQLATMVTAGLPLTDALTMLKLQSAPALSTVVEQMLKDVQEGTSLSGSMAKFPHVFTPVYVALVRAGEAAGVMETILDRLATTLEKQREFSGKVRGALVYPLIVILGMVAVMVIMLVVVVPKLTEVYSQFNAELPFMTQVLVAISSAMVNFWWLI
ncbi:MAG: type II secretion system F family protein, partial [bacterium]|nr:type II secretion system F family protein [bacterium]